MKKVIIGNSVLVNIAIIILLSATAYAGGFWSPFGGSGGGGKAEQVKYTNTTSGLTADDVQAAIDELDAAVDAVESGTISDLDVLPGDTVDDNLIDDAIVADRDPDRLIGDTVDDNLIDNVLLDVDLRIYAGITPSANVQTVLGCSTYADIRTALGLVIGTNVLAPDGDGSSLTDLIWSQIGSTPTTLSGYGITDGATAASLHLDDLVTLSGVAAESTHLSTFTGTTIADNQTIKAALQALETAIEGIGVGGLSDLDDLPGDTVDDNLIDAALLADLSSTYSITGHTHTGSTLSGIDIGDDTNLAGTANEITLTGDTLSLASTLDLSGKTLTLPATWTSAGSSTPGMTLTDIDAENGTAYILGASSGAYDIVTSLQTDIAGTATTFIELDGVDERIDLLKYALCANSMGVQDNIEVYAGTDLTGEIRGTFSDSDGTLALRANVGGTMTDFIRLCGNCEVTHFDKPIDLGSNGIAMTGSIAATGSRVTKGWFTDIESTNMPTVGGTSLSSTFAPIAHGSANDPDISTEGHLAWDANGDVLRGYDGTRQVAAARVQEEIHVTVVKPQDMADAVRDAFLVWSNESGMSFVITGWKAWSGTDDTTLNIETTAADGQTNATVDAVEIATNGTGVFTASDTTMTEATIANGSLIWLDFDDTDDPSYVKLTIYGYYNADVN